MKSPLDKGSMEDWLSTIFEVHVGGKERGTEEEGEKQSRDKASSWSGRGCNYAHKLDKGSERALRRGQLPSLREEEELDLVREVTGEGQRQIEQGKVETIKLAKFS